jgi:hypothetical protein
MKRKLILLSAVVIATAITTYGFVSANTVESKINTCSASESTTSAEVSTKKKREFILEVRTAFNHTVTKEDLQNAKDIADILPENALSGVREHWFVQVSRVNGSREITENGSESKLTSEQLELIQTMDYSNDIMIHSDCQRETDEGSVEYYDLIYYMSIVPATQAEYAEGNDALTSYIEEQISEELKKVDSDKIRPGKIELTISKDGEITATSIQSSCGYTNIDTKIKELLSNLPAKWNSAKNGNNTPVEQKLVFFYGAMGC